MKISTRGFTIVELLIVIVIIGILAAITIVAYNGIQNRSYDTSVQSDMRSIAKKMELARVDSQDDSYPLGNAPLLTAMVISVNKNTYAITPTVSYNLLMCYPTASSPKEYILLAQSKSGKRYSVRTGGTVTEYTGGATWTTSSSMCDSVVTSWAANGSGYASGDTTTGPWRAWVGGN